MLQEQKASTLSYSSVVFKVFGNDDEVKGNDRVSVVLQV